MDKDDLIEWTADQANDMLKAAYELQKLCKKVPINCCGCPFRKKNGKCVFKTNPSTPNNWNIQEETVYTVKIPDT